jgi:2',3'-cyclic-nucleotide 2'-phosphodiesterase (5'-nucleotidase family)
MAATVNRRTGTALLTIGLALAVAFAVLAPSSVKAQDTTTITVLHDTHFHGHFEDPHSDIARYFSLVGERKDAADHALFLGNGDDIAPSLLSGVFRGHHMIEAFNAAPIDYNTFGNHEFDYGPDQLRELVEESETFTWVSANVRDSETDGVFAEEVGAELFVIEEVGGVDVGITGLGPRDMAGITSMGDAAYEMPYVEAMEEVVPQMQDAGADLILVASHLCGTDARVLAEEVDGIDAIVGDHCAEVLEEPEYINDTIVSLVGHEFEYLGEITLEVVDGDVDDWSFQLHDLEAIDPEPDPDLLEIMEHYEAQLDEELNVEIGQREVAWDTRNEIVRTRESAIGNFFTDAYADGLDADIGLQNGGGIRSDQVYDPGPITRREIVQILPFENYMAVVEVPGSRLYDLLDEIVTSDGIRMQLSGLEVVYDSSQPEGERVVEATVGCEPIDPDATYTLATIDFLADGGSDMDGILDDLPRREEHNGDAGQLNSTFMIEYIEDMDGPVTTDVDGRMYRVDADYEQPEPLCDQPDEEIEVVCANAPESGHTDKGTTHAANIDCVVAYGIGQGQTATTFGTFDSLTRGQAATFLLNFALVATDGAIADEIDGDQAVPFTDIDGTTHEASIEAIARLGLIQGTTPTTYSPRDSITREQFATILYNAHVALGVGFEEDYDNPFTDTANSVHVDEISALAGEGIISGRTATTYNPDGDILRGQTATLFMESAGLLDGLGLWEAPRLE